MFNSRKGISPLVASVLLIVVVVGIGALVTGIVRDLVSDNQQTMESKSDAMVCSRDVSVELIRIDRAPQICKGSNYIDAVVENTGTADVDDFQLSVFGDTGFYLNDSIGGGDAFLQGEAKEFNGTFESVGNIEQVKLVPKLRKTGSSGYNFCTDVAITYEDLVNC